MPSDDIPDYYTEFGIGRGATAEDVRRRLDEALRLWAGRASRAADRDKRRDAEDKVGLVEQARYELLDRARRGAYDRRLARSRRPPPKEEKPPPEEKKPPPEKAKQTAATVRDWVAEARARLYAGDDEAALYELRQAVYHNDRDAEAWRLLGTVHARRGQYHDALQEFLRVLALRPDDSAAHRSIADVHIERGDRSAAADWLLKRARLAPDDPLVTSEAATTLHVAGRYDEAIQQYEQLLRQQPDNQAVRNSIGEIWELRALDATSWDPMRMRHVIASPESAARVAHCAEQGLAVGIADPQLARKLRAHRDEAALAVRKTWRRRKGMGCLLVVGIVVGVSTSPVAAASGFPIDWMFVGLAILLAVGSGYQPRWQHAHDSLPPHLRPPLER